MLVGITTISVSVDLLELGRFGFRRARHAAQLLIKAKVVLERDRSQRLVFLADVHAFLGLDRLVQPVAPAASRHQPAGEGVNNDHLSVFHHVLHVALVERVRLDGGFDVVLHLPVLGVGDIANAQQFLDRLPTLICDSDRAVFLIDNVIAAEKLLAFAQPDAEILLPPGVAPLHFFAQLELGNDQARARIFVRCLVGGSGNNQRRTRFVDQDRVHFVDNRVEVAALHAILDLELHVVAEIVEAELVVRAVGDVGGVSLAALVVVQVVHDHADRQPEKLVNFPHPFGVALGQVIVHRDHVHAVAGERIQVAGERGHQRLAFAGFHLGDLALVQNHAANQLHVEVAHLYRAPSCLANHREGLGQNLVERGLFGFLPLVGVGNSFKPRRNARLEFDGLCPQLLVRELLRLQLHRADFTHDGRQALEQALVGSAEDFSKNWIEKHGLLRIPV